MGLHNLWYKCKLLSEFLEFLTFGIYLLSLIFLKNKVDSEQ